MVNETKTSAEYKAPKCKVVGIHVQNLVCTSWGDEGEAGEKVKVDYDDDEY